VRPPHGKCVEQLTSYFCMERMIGGLGFSCERRGTAHFRIDFRCWKVSLKVVSAPLLVNIEVETSSPSTLSAERKGFLTRFETNIKVMTSCKSRNVLNPLQLCVTAACAATMLWFFVADVGEHFGDNHAVRTDNDQSETRSFYRSSRKALIGSHRKCRKILCKQRSLL
jgi:hypothetical protein